MKPTGVYTKKVLELFKKPHNYGKIKNPDGVGKVGNIVCGDVMWLYIKVGKNKKGEEIIKDIKFETFGCVAAISTSSVITDLAKGKTLDEALKIKKDNIVDSLGGLPPIKIHCSVLAVDALVEAIYDYLSKKKPAHNATPARMTRVSVSGGHSDAGGKPISKELKERHIRIEKEKQIIEEKYKGWIKTEEKMHEKQ